MTHSDATGGIVARNFSAAFEQMCNFVAVARTGDPNATIEGLIQVCLFRFAEDRFSSPNQLSETLETVFGVHIPSHQITDRIQTLLAKGEVKLAPGKFYLLSETARASLASRIDTAVGLEESVKSQWLASLTREEPQIGADVAWKALRRYLAGAFRRHGMQAAALLEGRLDTPSFYSESLSQLMDNAINEFFEPSQRDAARRGLSAFFLDSSLDADRSRFIVQLADSAFNFFSLEIPADAAARFRSTLSELTLFLDTNFMFGILDLHYNSQVEVSLELIRAIRIHKLPIRLRYHEATHIEMGSTIGHIADHLRAHRWSQKLSRAATKAYNLSGIEQKFHENNALHPISADDFLKPFLHFDVLLGEQDIAIYRPSAPRMEERVNLYHEYKSFLDKCGKSDKPYETVQHDATVLDTVRRLRSQAKSSLEAGALLVTCDYFLYRFDWETATGQERYACVVLPNALWQLLRPYIPSDGDFDKSFVETFALPEFRALSSGGSQACSRMMSVLASMGELPEETAEKLLANDAFLDHLRVVRDDKQFVKEIESEIAKENAHLLEEKAARERAFADTKTALDSAKEDLEQRDARLKALEKTQEELSRRLHLKEVELSRTEASLSQESMKASELTGQISSGQHEISELKDQLKTEAARGVLSAQTMRKAKAALAILVSAIHISGFLAFVRLYPWTWLVNHPNSKSIEISTVFLLLFMVIGVFYPATRKWVWSASGLGLGGLVLLIISKL